MKISPGHWTQAGLEERGERCQGGGRELVFQPAGAAADCALGPAFNFGCAVVSL